MDGHDNDRWIDGWSNMTLSLGAKSYLKAAMRKSNFFGQLFVRIGYEQKNRYASKRCFSTQQKKGRDFFQMGPLKSLFFFSYIGNKENPPIKDKIGCSLDIRYSEVELYIPGIVLKTIELTDEIKCSM